MKFLPAKKSFLSEEGGAENPADAKAVIIPFGLERTVSYGGGTANGPQAILDASGQLEMYDEELGCEAFRKYGVATLEPEKIAQGQEAALEQLSGIVQQVLDAGKFPMVLGGEHAITAGAIKPYAKKYDELWVLHFDAHADLRDGYDGAIFRDHRISIAEFTGYFYTTWYSSDFLNKIFPHETGIITRPTGDDNDLFLFEEFRHDSSYTAERDLLGLKIDTTTYRIFYDLRLFHNLRKHGVCIFA